MANKKRKQIQLDEATQQFSEATILLAEHPVFSLLHQRARIYRHESGASYPRKGWAVVTSNGDIYVHPTRYADSREWVYILIHCLLHLGFGHFQQRDQQAEWNVACDIFVARFMQDLKLGSPLVEMSARITDLPRSEEGLYQYFCERGIPEELKVYSTAGEGVEDMRFEPAPPFPHWYGSNLSWEQLFGLGLAHGVARAVDYAAGKVESMSAYANSKKSASELARSWFISSYPLLGALATGFKIIEDPLLCQRWQITVAAVDAEAGELFMNPAAGLDEEECRFVMAHELLHVALRHHARRQGRDPYLWNVACDYVINQWLREMEVGIPPAFGMLYDPDLKGLSAESVYDRIVG
ncbi:MAG: peptidase, partial [Chloroflexota bacterium]